MRVYVSHFVRPHPGALIATTVHRYGNPNMPVKGDFRRTDKKFTIKFYRVSVQKSLSTAADKSSPIKSNFMNHDSTRNLNFKLAV